VPETSNTALRYPSAVDGFLLYLAFLIPPLVLGLVVQAWLKRTFARYSELQVSSGLPGSQVARQILDRNGLTEVPVDVSPGGPLSDHYDPRKKALFLSEPVYQPPSIAAAAVAAHETGHALQDSRGYVPLKIRSAMYPAVAFASNAWIWLLLIGAVLNALGLVALALILYAVAVLFHLVTLPVEFNASRRASTQLRELGIVGAGEQEGVNKVLRAAALTYVAGALAALSLLLYYALIFFGNRD
jgi:Zn-dependent membrane protease YugP